MITEVSISNFKSIEAIERLELKPLTLLTGVNSSGKSNIMEAISFFAQASRFRETQDSEPTIESVYRRGEMKEYPGQLERFIVHKGDPRGIVTLEINVKPEMSVVDSIRDLLERNAEVVKYVFPERTTTTRTIPRDLIRTIGYSISFGFSFGPDELISQRTLINEHPLVEVQQAKGARLVTIPDLKTMETNMALENVLNEGVFEARRSDRVFDVLSQIARQLVIYLRDYAKHIYFVSGERGRISPEVYIREPRGRSPSWIGFNGQNLMEILSRCFTREPEKSGKIKEWAKRFQLPDLRAGYTERNVLESYFIDETLNTNLNAALTGLGSRQILSIITQIFWSEAPSVIMIEEPEISLHPENQVLLHELFSEAISEGKQIICSTHSPFFVLALSKTVKKKLLRLDQIAVYEIEKDRKGTHAKALKLDEHGFIRGGIPSFMTVEKDLFRDWSESLEED